MYSVGSLTGCLCEWLSVFASVDSSAEEPEDNPIFGALLAKDAEHRVGLLLANHPSAATATRHADAATPLHIAAVLGEPGLCQLLLRYDADPAAVDNSGAPALMVAARCGDLDVVSVLLGSGPDKPTQEANAELINHPDNEGVTPLFGACWRGHLEVAQELHRRGGRLDLKARTGWTARDAAERWDHKHIVEWIDSVHVTPTYTAPSPNRADPGP